MSSNIRKGPQEPEDEDPAEYILSNAECHDLYITVRDPGTGQTERVGVASTQLAAHSSVLRGIISAKRSAGSSNTDIIVSDVSPATFKLMLRHMYGGRLPTLTQKEAAQLAICAEGYNIKPLLKKALEILKPKDVETVFPALITTTSLVQAELEEEVAKIVQEQTDDLVRNHNFLHINMSSLLFIVEQQVLNITEVELWRNVIRWAENQVKLQPEKTMREILQGVLKHIRFLTFSVEEIVSYVLPSGILTSDEGVNLILTVTGNSCLKYTTLCDITEKRILYRKKTEGNIRPTPLPEPQFAETLVFNALEHFGYAERQCKTHSNFTVFPTKTLEMEKFICKTLKSDSNNTGIVSSYRFTCLVNVEEFKDGISISKEVIIITVNASFNSTAALHLKKKNGGSLILKANYQYKFFLEFEGPHPVHYLWNKDCPRQMDRTKEERSLACMRLQFDDDFHVLNIIYKV